MRHAGINARLKKKEKRDAVSKRSIVYHGTEEKLKYDNFWVGVERSMLVQKTSLRSKRHRKVGNSMHDGKSVGNSGLFHPNSPGKIAWDIFVGVMIMFSVITIPFRISFQLPTSATFQELDYFLDVVFFVDMVANFNTALQDANTDTLVLDRKVVVCRYLQFWFWIDLVSTLPLEEMVGALLSKDSSNKLASVRLIRIVRLMRIVKLARVVKLSRLSAHIEKLYINPALLSVVSLVLKIFFIAHLVSCFWYFLTTSDVTNVIQPSQDSGLPIAYTTWITQSGMLYQSILDKYVAAFYWTFATMLSIGYGDIRPTNADERVYAICTMLGGGILFGAVIAQVTRLIEVRNPQARIFKQKMASMKAYLGEKSLPMKLKVRAKEAYAYSLQRKSSLSESGGVFEELPQSLMLKLIRYIYDKEIYSINLFRNAEFSFVASLVSKSLPFQVATEEILYRFGDVAEELFFVIQGQVRVTTTSGSREVIAGYVTDGGFFGDFEFISKSTRSATYVAASTCTLLSVSFQVMEDTIGENPDAGMHFKEEIQRRFDLFRRAIRMPVQNTAKTRNRRASDKSGLPQINNSRASLALSSDKVDRDNVARPDPKIPPIDPKLNSIRKRQSFHVASKRDQTAVRTKIWLDGELSPPDCMEHDVEASEAAKRMHTKHQLYRVMKLDEEGQEVISEETVDQMINRFLLHPKGTRKNYWDVIVGVFIIYSVLMIPVQIAFSRSSENEMSNFDHVVDAFFFLDIFYCCRTAYYSEEIDAYVAIPSKIWWHYASTWFLVDFFSSIPFDEILSAAVGKGVQGTGSIRLVKIFRLTRLLKLARLLKLTKYISKLEDEAGVSPVVFDLLKMICEVVFIAHLVCCLWWGATANMTTIGWMDDAVMCGEDLRDAPLFKQYIAALYWTFTTLTTVGYGDIYSINTSERALNVIIMILGATVFGYVVANMSTLMGNLNQTQALQREKISEITEYLNEKNCPQHLSASIVRYFRHRYSRSSAFDEEGIMARLPKRLCYEISLHDCQDIMKRIPLFKFIENKNVALYIFKCMTPLFFDADHYIIREGEVPMEILFFVAGRARVYKRVRKEVEENGTEGSRKSLLSNSKSSLLETRVDSNKKFRNVPEKFSGSELTVSEKPLNLDSTIRDDCAISSRSRGQSEGMEVKGDGKSAVSFDMSSSSGAKENKEMPSSGRASRLTLNFESLFGSKSKTETSQISLEPTATQPHSTLTGRSNLKPAVQKKRRLSWHGGASAHSNKPPVPLSVLQPPSLNTLLGSSVVRRSGGSFKANESSKDNMVPVTQVQQAANATSKSSDQRQRRATSASKRTRQQRTGGGASTNNNSSVAKTSGKQQESVPVRRGFSFILSGQMFQGSAKGSPGFEQENEVDYESDDDLKVEEGDTAKKFSKQTEEEMEKMGRVVIGELHSGDFVGHGALMRHARHGCTVRAVEPCSMYVLRRTEIMRLLRDQPGVIVILQMALGQATNELREQYGQELVRLARARFLRECRSKYHQHYTLHAKTEEKKEAKQMVLSRLFGAKVHPPTAPVPTSVKDHSNVPPEEVQSNLGNMIKQLSAGMSSATPQEKESETKNAARESGKQAKAHESAKARWQNLRAAIKEAHKVASELEAAESGADDDNKQLSKQSNKEPKYQAVPEREPITGPDWVTELSGAEAKQFEGELKNSYSEEECKPGRTTPRLVTSALSQSLDNTNPEALGHQNHQNTVPESLSSTRERDAERKNVDNSPRVTPKRTRSIERSKSPQKTPFSSQKNARHLFSAALRARVKGQVDVLLNDKNINYNSSDEDDEVKRRLHDLMPRRSHHVRHIPTSAYIFTHQHSAVIHQTEKPQQKDSTIRRSVSLGRAVPTSIHSSTIPGLDAATTSTKPAVTRSLKKHRSCSDLVAVSRVSSREVTRASAVTPYNQYQRRMSFPSYDIKKWKATKMGMAML